MGRHAAGLPAAAADGPAPAPFGESAHPVTDPRLFDAPPAPPHPGSVTGPTPPPRGATLTGRPSPGLPVQPPPPRPADGGARPPDRRPAPSAPARDQKRTRSGRTRPVTLAACAIAVLGAVSGTALLLPGHASRAQADNLATPSTSPIPVADSGAVAFLAQAAAPRRSVAAAAGRVGARRAHVAAALRTVTPASGPTGSAPRSAATAATRTPAPTASTSGAPPVGTTGLDLRSIIRGASAGSLLQLQPSTYVLHDFDSQLMGADLGTDGIVGAGVDRTVIEMAPHSSTKAGDVPTAAYSTNQLYLLSTIGGTPGLSGFTVKATDQGHLYNGVRVGHATNARVHDVTIESVPGSNSFPPGETFVLNDWRTTGSVYDRITIDGGGVAAAGFGVNSSSDITIEDSTLTGTAYSSGAAFWQSRNITLNDVRIVDNRSGLNFERDTGSITLNRPTFSGNRLYDIQMGSDQGGADVVINDPVLAAGQKIRMNVPADYRGGGNNQSRSRIHVYVNGVDRTSQLVQFL